MTRRSFASAEASYFFDWQVFRHCGADLLLTRLKRRQKLSTHSLTGNHKGFQRQLRRGG